VKTRHFLLSVLLLAGCATTTDPPASSSGGPSTTNGTAGRNGANGTTPTPPTFNVDIPSWPPLGKTGRIDVAVSDDEALSRLTATFKNVARRTFTGTTGSISLSGSDLGEGMGTLTLVACDTRDACRERRVNDFLVDMTPPEAELESPTISPKLEGIDGQVAVWVSDAWVLGSVDFTFEGKTLHHDFPKAYPSTVGTEWDVSRVTFAAKDLPEKEGQATVVVRDAAGNARTQSFHIRIDGTAPTVAITQPANGANVGASFDVALLATDEGPTPPTVELWVGGARVLDAVAPAGAITIDASTLPPGPTTVQAIARDPAGNRSTVSSITVNVTN
jgi:hypothetical protein